MSEKDTLDLSEGLKASGSTSMLDKLNGGSQNSTVSTNRKVVASVREQSANGGIRIRGREYWE